MRSEWSTEIKNRYEKLLLEDGWIAYRYATILASSLYPSGIFLDWFSARPHFWGLTLIRGSASILCLILFIFSKKPIVKNNPFNFMVLFTFVASLGITAMCLIQGGYESSYYAGVCLVMVAIGILLPYGVRHISVIIGTAYLSYWLPVLIQARFNIENIAAFVNNLFFLTLTGIIGIAAAHVRTRMRVQAFEGVIKLEAAHVRLQEFDRLKSQFFSNVSHELRTPLTLILGSAERWTQRLESADSDVKRYIESIHANARMVLKHVNDLLDISKIEAGRMQIHAEPVVLSPFVKKIAGLFEVLAEEKEISFQVSVPDIAVVLDSEKMERVLANLLSNAFKFSPPDSTVELRVTNHESTLKFEIEDEGPGVPEIERDKVFKRFYQASSGDSRAHGGTGLGLSIVKEFVELHEGSVEIRAGKKGGALLVVSIPLIVSETASIKRDLSTSMMRSHLEVKNLESELIYQSGQTQNVSKIVSSEPEVLLVEDNPEMRAFIESSLEGDFRIASAPNAIEALELLKTIKPEVILTDLMMPQMPGEKFLEVLKASDDFSSIPVIFLTAKADDEMRVRVLNKGAADYLIKPFSVNELQVRLRNWLELARARKSLQTELKSKSSDLQSLATEIIHQKHRLELATRSALLSKNEAIESSQAKSQFLSFVSHELRTPLTVISISAQMLARNYSNLSPVKQTNLISNVLRSSRDLQGLVDTLLEYSRIQKGKFEPKLSTFALNELIAPIILEQREVLRNKNLQLHSVIETQESIETDKEMLKLILSNLVSNAVKYTSSGEVCVKTKLRGNIFSISVSDTGVGIDQANLEKIFEAFERLPGSQPGLGIGLTLVKFLVDALGGRILVKSAVGAGSRFTILLPREFHRDATLENLTTNKLG